MIPQEVLLDELTSLKASHSHTQAKLESDLARQKSVLAKCQSSLISCKNMSVEVFGRLKNSLNRLINRVDADDTDSAEDFHEQLLLTKCCDLAAKVEAASNTVTMQCFDLWMSTQRLEKQFNHDLRQDGVEHITSNACLDQIISGTKRALEQHEGTLERQSALFSSCQRQKEIAEGNYERANKLIAVNLEKIEALTAENDAAKERLLKEVSDSAFTCCISN